ncbi:MAG: hypothetical protein PHC97_01230 [Patescibacteria group bacterium]|nr:hypothetical protein [Patescibacteria group bacterium]
MRFTIGDFDSLISKDKIKIRKVDDKLKSLIKEISKGLDYFYGVYKYKNRYSGFFSKTRDRKIFFNLQINSEDLSLEFQVESKPLILKFIKNVKIETIKNLKEIGDCEIVVWDNGKKVIKLYPEYLDDLTIKFLINKIKTTKNPIIKIRKIYSRENQVLRSDKLADSILKDIKQMEDFYSKMF